MESKALTPALPTSMSPPRAPIRTIWGWEHPDRWAPSPRAWDYLPPWSDTLPGTCHFPRGPARPLTVELTGTLQFRRTARVRSPPPKMALTPTRQIAATITHLEPAMGEGISHSQGAVTSSPGPAHSSGSLRPDGQPVLRAKSREPMPKGPKASDAELGTGTT